MNNINSLLNETDDTQIRRTQSPAVETKLLVILHPNTTRASIVISDRVFNLERYTHTRATEPVGAEKNLIDYLETRIVPVRQVHAGKNEISFELAEGSLPHEWVPQAVVAVKEFFSSDPDFSCKIYCDDRRWKVNPVYDDTSSEWPLVVAKGIPFALGEVDIGIDYIIASLR